MDAKLSEFIKLHGLFKSYGYSLYLVGGTVRDYLLGLPLDDMDAVTDATPTQIKEFFPDANYTFERFGSVVFKSETKVKFDITTLREESGYKDSRHPGQIIFVKELEKDVKRRDFTVNGLYMDSSLKVIDLVDGQNDLEEKVLRMIGDADKRIKEDPLRIIRALRFKHDFGFVLSEELEASIKNNISDLDYLNKEKIIMDINKCKPTSKEGIINDLKAYGYNL